MILRCLSGMKAAWAALLFASSWDSSLDDHRPPPLLKMGPICLLGVFRGYFELRSLRGLHDRNLEDLHFHVLDQLHHLTPVVAREPCVEAEFNQLIVSGYNITSGPAFKRRHSL